MNIGEAGRGAQTERPAERAVDASIAGDAPAQTVLHLAPHPDDELIGAPATLMSMRDAGWRIVNLACSLGSPPDIPRRTTELNEACHRAGFELRIADSPLADPLSPADLAGAQASIGSEITATIHREKPTIVVAPSPHDGHHGHEVVGRAAVEACERIGWNGRLWLWGLWADLPFPTVAAPFGEDRMAEILRALGAHAGELDRNDYRRVVHGRAEMNASLGPERVFGFGASAPDVGYLEVLCEVGLTGRTWRIGSPRWLEPTKPVTSLGAEGIGRWLHSPSLNTIYTRTVYGS